MRQSNIYVIGFAIAMTVICGGLLALASTGLGPLQKKQIELDTQKQILSAVMEINKSVNVHEVYLAQIESYVVNIDGDKVEGIEAEKVDTRKIYKEKDAAKKLFPVFEYKNEKGELDAYIIPVYGMGLWNNVYGFLAIDKDMNTIKGASFGHVGETPGLGARITDADVQARFVGKKLSGDGGEFIHFIKGETSQASFTDYEVDGLSGATMTTKGMNAMFEAYIGYYKNYFDKLKQ